MECYIHHIPGRLRVRIPAVRNNVNIAAEVREMLNLYGVDQLKVNHLTGSVVVKYDPNLITGDNLLNILRDKGLYDSSRAISCDDQIHRASSKAASKFGRVFFSYAVGKALEASGFPLLAALI